MAAARARILDSGLGILDYEENGAPNFPISLMSRTTANSMNFYKAWLAKHGHSLGDGLGYLAVSKKAAERSPKAPKAAARDDRRRRGEALQAVEQLAFDSNIIIDALRGFRQRQARRSKERRSRYLPAVPG